MVLALYPEDTLERVDLQVRLCQQRDLPSKPVHVLAAAQGSGPGWGTGLRASNNMPAAVRMCRLCVFYVSFMCIFCVFSVSVMSVMSVVDKIISAC